MSHSSFQSGEINLKIHKPTRSCAAKAQAQIKNFLDDGDDDQKELLKLGRRGLKYATISDEIRNKFIQEIVKTNCTIKSSAKKYGINFSTAKAIMQIFLREGRVTKKNGRKELGKQQKLVKTVLLTPYQDQFQQQKDKEQTNLERRMIKNRKEKEILQNKSFSTQTVSDRLWDNEQQCRNQQKVELNNKENKQLTYKGPSFLAISNFTQLQNQVCYMNLISKKLLQRSQRVQQQLNQNSQEDNKLKD